MAMPDIFLTIALLWFNAGADVVDYAPPGSAWGKSWHGDQTQLVGVTVYGPWWSLDIGQLHCYLQFTVNKEPLDAPAELDVACDCSIVDVSKLKLLKPLEPTK
jgi:hypothetical protein